MEENPVRSRSALTTTVLLATLWLAISVLFVLLRLDHLRQVLASPPGRILIIDSLYYYQWAQKIASGAGLGPTVFFMSPLYPLFIALAMTFRGDGVAATMLLQVLLSLLTLALIARFTVRRFGHVAGLLAGLIFTLYAPAIYYDGVLLSASLILFLTMAALTFLDLASEHGGRGWTALAGVAIALSALARPSALILLPLFAWVMIRRWKRYGAELAAVLIGAALLVLFPAMLRNYLHGGEWYLTTNSAGVNVYIGNHPNASGIYTEAPWLTSAQPENEAGEYRQEAERRTGRPMSVSAASRFWLRSSLGWIAGHPVEWLLLEAKKLAFFFNAFEVPNNVGYYGVREYSTVLRRLRWMHFGVLAPLGLVGLFLAWRERSTDWAKWLVGGTLAACLMVFVSSEYRYPILGVLIAYAAGAVTRIAAMLREKRIERAQVALMALLVLLMACNVPWKRLKIASSPGGDYFNWASVSFARGDLTNAALLFTASLSWNPTGVENHIQLAQVYDEMGLHDLADWEYQAAGITRESFAEARLRVGNTEPLPDTLSGDTAGLSPGRLADLGARFNRLKKYRHAVRVLSAAVARDTTNLDARFEYAFALEATGRWKEALEQYYAVERLRPEDPLLPLRIAWTYHALGDPGSARSTLRRMEKKIDALSDNESKEQWRAVLQKARDEMMNY